MCTIVLAWRVWADWPLVVAANRDETLQRISMPPQLRTHGSTTLLAPRDVQAGGTWLGINAAGMFVGITNRFDPTLRGRRFEGSRGTVVLDALARASVAEAAAAAASIRPEHQGPFHLLIADRERVALVWSDTRRLHTVPVAPGITVVTERSFEAAPTQREPALRRTLADAANRPAPAVEQWRRWLSVHDADAPLDGACVHAHGRGYGTRSATVLRMPAGDAKPSLHFADGPPCVTPLVDLGADVDALWDTRD